LMRTYLTACNLRTSSLRCGIIFARRPKGRLA
jgi:hypothetical protein